MQQKKSDEGDPAAVENGHTKTYVVELRRVFELSTWGRAQLRLPATRAATLKCGDAAFLLAFMDDNRLPSSAFQTVE